MRQSAHNQKSTINNQQSNFQGDLMSDEVTTQLAGYITTKILKQPKRVLKDDEPLISSGLIDSFHLVDLALFVEENFGVQLDDSELNRDTFDTLEQLGALIRLRKG
jgi:acyl carrier protein